jgi:hypothetical protein
VAFSTPITTGRRPVGGAASQSRKCCGSMCAAFALS